MRILIPSILSLVSFFANGQALSGEEMMKLVPDKINGFRQTEESRSNLLKVGNLSYSICQKGFSSGSKHITILLFDFKSAPIMYTQVTKEWIRFQPISSDTLTLTPIFEPNYFGWVTNTANQSSKIFLGIAERFYLAIDGKNVDQETLYGILKLFSLDQFPK